MITPDHIATIFRLMDEGLRRAGVGSRKGLAPIDIEVGSAPRVVWSFDPGRRDGFFTPGRHPRSVLSLSCTARFLLRLLSDDSLEIHDGDLIYFGDIGALEALTRAIARPMSINAARFGAHP